MPEPFKNAFNKTLIKNISLHLHAHWPEFNHAEFESCATYNLEALELKDRSLQITNALIDYLPQDFKKAGSILLASLSPESDDTYGLTPSEHGISGWAIMPMSHYVALKGHDHFTLSMRLLKELTKRFTSEFAIRFFLLENQEKTLKTLKKWTKDKNKHVRRLASEGCRPRLPWAMQLPAFIDQPTHIIEILEALKDDKEEYVRRSVANNLNDISKDHPDLISKIAKQWMNDADTNRTKLIHHACRTLIKSSHKNTLTALGFKPAKLSNISLQINTPNVTFGTALEFSLNATSNTTRDQPLIIDYTIHHQKANGTTTPKVFKWKKFTLKGNQEIKIQKKHAFRPITTRTYHPGKHAIEITINGVSVAKTEFLLKM